MEWIKERVMRCRVETPTDRNPDKRIHFRLRSDGMMFYQVITQGGPLDTPQLLQEKFDGFLAEKAQHLPVDESGFDATFETNLMKTRGKEVQISDSFANLPTSH